MNTAAYWRATRAFSFPASVVPVLLGGVLAAAGYAGHRAFHVGTLLLTLAGAVLAHFSGNVLNDYFDYVLGVDTRPEHGSGVLTDGSLTPQQALLFGAALMAGAALCGLALLPGHAAIIVPLALLGLACAVLYPAVLKRLGLGDLLIVLSFGIGLTVGAYGVQEGALNARQGELVSLVSLPVCLLVDAILHANNLRDSADDRAVGVRTLATILSPEGGRRLQLFLLFGPVALSLLGVGLGLLPVWSLGTLLALPALLRAARTGLVPLTAQAHLAFGLLYTLAFVPALLRH